MQIEKSLNFRDQNKAQNIRDYWENPSNISLMDRNLKKLEIDSVIPFLKENFRVLDIGCGDGEGTIEYAKRVVEIIGIDYSSAMIKKSLGRAQEHGENMNILQADVLSLPFCSETFDVVITERCLINLESWELQRGALESIREVLKEGGLYLMLETTLQGLGTLNGMRERVGLKPIPMPWHNQNFDLERLLSFLERGFQLVQRKSFGLYYFLSRVIHPLLAAPEEPRYDAKINQVAYFCQKAFEISGLEEVGPLNFFVLRKVR